MVDLWVVWSVCHHFVHVRCLGSPCSVSVMDCSSFSNSSVSVRLRAAAVLWRDIVRYVDCLCDVLCGTLTRRVDATASANEGFGA